MLKLSHKVTKEQIESYSIKELKKVLIDLGHDPSVFKGYKKTDYVNLVDLRVDDMRREHKEIEAVKEKERLEQIEIDHKDRFFNNLIQNLIASIERELEKLNDRIEKRRKELIGNTSAAYFYKWDAGDLVKEEYLRKWFTEFYEIQKYFNVNRHQTRDEWFNDIKKSKRYNLQKLMSSVSWSYTNGEQYEFAALQSWCSFLTGLEFAIEQAMDDEEVRWIQSFYWSL